MNLLLKNYSPFAKIIHNEYKFYIDFKGLLYFDDSSSFIFPNCIKDIKFINQLYRHIQPNYNNSEPSYPFVAQFWGERNFIRSAISPIIFNGISSDSSELSFSLNQKWKFYPQKLEMDREGRIWHPYKEEIKGVFSNELLGDILQDIRERDKKTFLQYRGETYEIRKEKC